MSLKIQMQEMKNTEWGLFCSGKLEIPLVVESQIYNSDKLFTFSVYGNSWLTLVQFKFHADIDNLIVSLKEVNTNLVDSRYCVSHKRTLGQRMSL